jgi:hypothetical protein
MFHKGQNFVVSGEIDPLAKIFRHLLQQAFGCRCHTDKHTNIMRVTEVLMPISIIGSFGMSVYFFTKIITDYILKKRMIEKGFVNEDTQAIFKTHQSSSRFSALKWGLLALFGGVGLILIEYLNVDLDSTLPYGILSVSLSAGFLVYYYLVKQHLDK